MECKGDGDLRISNTLLTEGMLEYPYFYIAVDGWMDTRSWSQLGHYIPTQYQGIIGTIPWQPRGLSKDVYQGMHSLYETANRKYDQIEAAYNQSYPDDGPMGTRLIYAFDSTMAMAHALQKIDQDYGLWFVT